MVNGNTLYENILFRKCGNTNQWGKNHTSWKAFLIRRLICKHCKWNVILKNLDHKKYNWYFEGAFQRRTNSRRLAACQGLKKCLWYHMISKYRKF